MPLRSPVPPPTLLLIGIVLLLAAADAALAQNGPFGIPHQPAPTPQDNILGWFLPEQLGWVITKVAEFERSFSRLIRATKADGSAAWVWFGVAFVYGAFHAVSLGHGKAVISSYLVANEETWRRGVVLSFASAMLQAVVAVALVGIATVIIGVTSRTMTQTANWIGIASYSVVALMGARLTWSKGRDFIAAWRASAHPRDQDQDQVHGHDRRVHRQDHSHDHRGDHRHVCAAPRPAAEAHAHAGHDHEDDHDHHGHSHGPEPRELAGPGGWRRGFSTILAVGLRPCSGAIIMLVFAVGQGLFWIGTIATFVMAIGTAITVAAVATLAVMAKALAMRIAAHRAGGGTLAVRGLEVMAAVLILAFGLALLTGYMVSERMI